MVNLFWALFGVFDRAELSLKGKHAFTEYTGKSANMGNPANATRYAKVLIHF